MKKLLSIALCTAAVSAFGAATEVDLGDVGVTAITSTSRQTVFAVSYDELAGADGMSVSNLVKTANLTAGDLLAVFNGTTYDTWVLQDKAGVKTWGKNDKTFVVTANGQLVEGQGNSAAETKMDVGAGVWLVRNADYVSGTPFTFYVYGKPVENPVFTVPAGKAVLFGNPLQTPATPTVSGMENGDVISIPREGLPPMMYTYNTTKSAWRYQKESGAFESGLPEFMAGVGCWYKAKAVGGNRTIQWGTK